MSAYLLMDRESLKHQYRGDTAMNYEDDRKTSEKWDNEQRAVERFLRYVDADVDGTTKLLDIPVGTGRFFDIYRELGAEVLGVDVSEDMIEQASESVTADDGIELTQGDIFQLDSYDIEPDVVVCVRLLNWFELEDFRDAVRNIGDTNPDFAIVSVRTTASKGDLEDSTEFASLPRRAVRTLLTEGAREFVDSTASFVRRKMGSEPTITIHERGAVVSVFEDCGFDIGDRELVDESENTQYHIYLLESTET